jgi:hypothetical protein
MVKAHVKKQWIVSDRFSFLFLSLFFFLTLNFTSAFAKTKWVISVCVLSILVLNFYYYLFYFWCFLKFFLSISSFNILFHLIFIQFVSYSFDCYFYLPFVLSWFFFQFHPSIFYFILFLYSILVLILLIAIFFLSFILFILFFNLVPY